MSIGPLPPQRRLRAGATAAALALVAGAGPTACAARSGGPASDAVRNPSAGTLITTRIDGGGGTAMELRSVGDAVSATEATVPAGAEQTFAALPGAYEAVGLSINTVLSDARTLGVREGRAPRRLARQPLSRYLECGADAVGTRHADAWAVTITALTRVTPARDSASTVRTQVTGSARPLTTSGSAVPCTSTGFLEQAINNAIVVQARR